MLGFGDAAELARRAKRAEEASAAYANIRYQPEYAREQDAREGYYTKT